MKRETLEWAFHLWDDWRDSIREARDKFNITPGMSWQQLNEWRRTSANRDRECTDFGIEEMRRLRLPKVFYIYWKCCVFADFDRREGSPDFDTIRDIFLWRRPRVYPAFFPTLELPLDVMALAKDPEEKHYLKAWDLPLPEFPTFTIEGHFHLVDRESLEDTIRRVLKLKKLVLEVCPHPLVDLIPKGRERVRAAARQHQLEMMEKYRKGEATTDDLLRDEYWSQNTREELELLRQAYRASTWRYRDGEKKMRKKVLDRIRSRIKSAGLSYRGPKTKWWSSQ